MDDMALGMIYGANRRLAGANSLLEGAGALVAGAERIIDDKNARIVELKAQIAQLELSVLLGAAHAEGLTAQLRGFIAAHPNSPERVESGKRYEDGKPKTVGRIRYEEAHDAFLKENQVLDPENHRFK